MAVDPTFGVDWGTDIDWLDDLNPTGRLVSGIELLRQAVFHRLSTPRGACLDAPDDGLDLAEYLHKGVTPAELAGLPGEIRSELLKDPRFLDADVTLTATGANAYHVKILVTPSLGPEFDLVLSVEDAAVKLLSATQGA